MRHKQWLNRGGPLFLYEPPPPYDIWTYPAQCCAYAVIFQEKPVYWLQILFVFTFSQWNFLTRLSRAVQWKYWFILSLKVVCYDKNGPNSFVATDWPQNPLGEFMILHRPLVSREGGDKPTLTPSTPSVSHSPEPPAQHGHFHHQS